MPQQSCQQDYEGEHTREHVPSKSESATHDACDSGRRDVTQMARRISSLPFESFTDNRDISKTGAISPLRFEDIYKVGDTVAHVDKDAPPVDEIIFPKPQTIDSSTCSINEDTAPVTNCGASEDYKHLFFCSQREVHSLRGHIASVEDENRQLKRKMIEMQKRLYAYSRNKRQSTNTGALGSAWSIPPTSFKRNRVDVETTVEPDTKRARFAPSSTEGSSVRMSVSTEDCTSEANDKLHKV